MIGIGPFSRWISALAPTVGRSQAILFFSITTAVSVVVSAWQRFDPCHSATDRQKTDDWPNDHSDQ